MDQNGKDDLKTQFVTREGTYRLMTLSEYSRPNRVGYQSNQNNPQVRVSLITLPAATSTATGTATATANASTNNLLASVAGGSTSTAPVTTAIASTTAVTSIPAVIANGQDATLGTAQQTYLQQLQHELQQEQHGSSDRICFNFGKELYVYAYRGVKKNADLCKPIDKKLYKGTNPSCHDFNETLAASDSAPLLVGFTTGQIQLVQPGKREPGRLYNEERLIDKSKVTCLKWLPKSPNLFLASHSSGHLYLYNEELPCTPTAPSYQHFKMGDGFTILTCKSKSTRNPLYKWTFGTDNCSINEFCFSPCGSMLAIVSQDGFLRVFHYDTMELLGIARSYFGGFLCVCWSPDGKYIVVGGEDDLVTVWSLHERRVVARGQGHRSWVSVVAFDPYTSFSSWDGPDFSDDENPVNDSYGLRPSTAGASHYTNDKHRNSDVDRESIPITGKRPKSGSFRDSLVPDKLSTCYRLGSVGQDTQICLWDITEDVLRHSYEIRQRLSSHDPHPVVNGDVVNNSGTSNQQQPQQPQQPQPQQQQPQQQPQQCNSGLKSDSVDSKNSSNSKTRYSGAASKFCGEKILEGPEDPSRILVGIGSVVGSSGSDSGRNSFNENSKHTISSIKNSSNNAKNVMVNSVNTTNSNCIDTVKTGTNSESGPSKSTKSSDSGLNAFNSITQRLSNFSFGNDKKSADGHNGHKKTFTFSKSTGNHIQNNSSGSSGSNCDNGASATSMKNSKNSSNNVVPSFDPMKLIGSAACPRFDECPLLEPLVCKKIAHERLTALIFREDCFLTACQDGFIYTWARPGFSAELYHSKNIHPHNVSNSPSGTTGGTVV